MNASSKYWTICQISLAKSRVGYERRLIPSAQVFFQQQFSNLPPSQSTDIQVALLARFQSLNPESNVKNRAHNGLCLRCYVSYSILKTCQTIDNLFAGDKQFTYQDLLPFVLNDDGKTLIILGEGNAQLRLNEAGDTQSTSYKTFAVELLRTYKSDSPSSMSLDNWAFLQTKQHPELKNFLSEFGFQPLSDWALLNRGRVRQLEQLSDMDRHLVEVFHAVYRRDRRQQQKVRRCPDPTTSQLQEMGELLQQRGVEIKSVDQLLKALRQVAKQLRQFDVWQAREPLEIQDSQTGEYQLRVDLPSDSMDELDAEKQEFLEFLNQQLETALSQNMEQAIQTQITQLGKSKKYAPFASGFIRGLQLYYCEGLSLREIGPQLGMSSWDQTRRILNPGELLSQVRRLTVQQLLDPILTKAQEQGFIAKSAAPDHLKTLLEQLEAFVDEEIFAEAVSEIKAGKNRQMDSIYAQQLKRYVEQNV
jgi:hypothetical protein